MKTLKLWMVLALLCMIASTLAQDAGFDGYTYQSSLQCESKITVRTGETKYPIKYRLTYNLATPTQGTLDKNGIVELRLPISRQLYDLIIERDVADKDAYTIETGACANVNAVMAPPPVMTQKDFAAAQVKLREFIRLIHD